MPRHILPILGGLPPKKNSLPETCQNLTTRITPQNLSSCSSYLQYEHFITPDFAAGFWILPITPISWLVFFLTLTEIIEYITQILPLTSHSWVSRSNPASRAIWWIHVLDHQSLAKINELCPCWNFIPVSTLHHLFLTGLSAIFSFQDPLYSPKHHWVE